MVFILGTSTAFVPNNLDGCSSSSSHPRGTGGARKRFGAAGGHFRGGNLDRFLVEKRGSYPAAEMASRGKHIESVDVDWNPIVLLA